MLTQQTRDKLVRMAELNVLFNSPEGESATESQWDEYRALLQEAVAAFQPVVQSLVDAGLFTVSIERQELETWTKKSPGWESAQLDVTSCFCNGNIWLDCGSVCGLGLGKK
jgi:hypothetical protein